jgi:hypothetical protein
MLPRWSVCHTSLDEYYEVNYFSLSEATVVVVVVVVVAAYLQ